MPRLKNATSRKTGFALINARQFAEAADLSEDLLQRFPDSPQAAYLTELLPKLRERSALATQDIIT